MVRPLRVGIIGANARGGWAADSHVPAVQGLAGLGLAAIATNRQETADEAAHAFGVAKAYASGDALIADPDIDLVTVATASRTTTTSSWQRWPRASPFTANGRSDAAWSRARG